MSVLTLAEPEAVGFSSRRLEDAVTYLAKGVGEVYPGAILLAARNGKVFLHKAVGSKWIIPQEEPMGLDSIIELASVTKPIAVGLGMMFLVEDGLLSLTDTLVQYLPEFKVAGGESIRLVDLLTHTSGLASHPKLHYEHATAESLLQAYLELPLAYAPRTQHLYSSIGFIFAGLVIERVSGKRLDQFIQERLFGPLKLKDTMFLPSKRLHDRIAATQRNRATGEIEVGIVDDKVSQKMGCVTGHAGLFSTAWELGIIGQMLLNGGVYGDQQILSPLSIQRMWTNFTAHLPVKRGAGWWLGQESAFGELFGKDSVGHTGHSGTSLCLIPSLSTTVVFLTNRIHPSDANNQIARFRPLLHNCIAAAYTGAQAKE